MKFNERRKACHGLITEDAVKEALKEDKGIGAHLTSWIVEDFTKRGDNYVAWVTSVRADYSLEGMEGHTSYVVKVNPCHDAGDFTGMIHAIFIREAEFYTKLLPRLNHTLLEVGMGTLAIPLCYYTSLEKNKELIFLEDLRSRGFKLFDRRKGLDVTHTTLVLKELAKLHASSLLLQKEDPHSLEMKLLNRPWGSVVEGAHNLIAALCGALETAITILKRVDGYKAATTWIESLKGRLRQVFENEVKLTKYHVLGHGDPWNNNLLFRYNQEDHPVEAMLVDLQSCRRVSFASDLNFLLYTSLTGAVRKPNLEGFLEAYRQEFNAVLDAGGGGGDGGGSSGSVREKATEGRGATGNGEGGIITGGQEDGGGGTGVIVEEEEGSVQGKDFGDGSVLRLSQSEVLEEFRSKNIIGAIFGMATIGVVLVEPEDTVEVSASRNGNFDECFEEVRKKTLEMVDSNPQLRPRFLAMFDEFMRSGLIPSRGGVEERNYQ